MGPSMDLRAPFYFVVARPLAFGSLPAPMHTEGVHMGANRAPIKKHAKSYPLGKITLWVNFGQNYRDLGHFVRVTFMAKN